MAKAKPAEPVEVPKINKSAEVTKILKEFGENTTYAEVQQHLASRGINIAFESSLVSVLKKKLFGAGAVRRGGRGSVFGYTGTSTEATISDLKRAKDFAAGLKMKPSELLALVAQINAFGDLETLEACLKALEELTG